MHTRWLFLLLLGVVAFKSPAATQNQESLDIYYIDVEGGAATLFVSPSGQSMFVDSGHLGSVDAERIAAVVREVGLDEINYLVTTHYHLDHVGGAPELSARVPIKNFVDHGLPTTQELDSNQPLYEAYLTTRETGRHIVVRAGDTIPIEGLDVKVVSSREEFITVPLVGNDEPNPLCRELAPKEETRISGGENGRSVGLVIQYGDVGQRATGLF